MAMEVLYVKSNVMVVARETILSEPADKKGQEKIDSTWSEQWFRQGDCAGS